MIARTYSFKTVWLVFQIQILFMNEKNHRILASEEANKAALTALEKEGETPYTLLKAPSLLWIARTLLLDPLDVLEAAQADGWSVSWWARCAQLATGKCASSSSANAAAAPSCAPYTRSRCGRCAQGLTGSRTPRRWRRSARRWRSWWSCNSIAATTRGSMEMTIKSAVLFQVVSLFPATMTTSSVPVALGAASQKVLAAVQRVPAKYGFSTPAHLAVNRTSGD